MEWMNGDNAIIHIHLDEINNKSGDNTDYLTKEPDRDRILIQATLEQIAYISKYGGTNNGFLHYYFTPTIWPEDETQSLPKDGGLWTPKRDLKYVRLSAEFINPTDGQPDIPNGEINVPKIIS